MTDSSIPEHDVKELVESLAGSSRRARQVAAKAFSEIAKASPADVLPYGGEIIDALNRPEAQTRWECLDVLTELVALDPEMCEAAIVGAETALFDEDNGLVRLAAMRFLCALGATCERRSDLVWSLIDEGIQCYHGDLEFSDMLTAVTEFSLGNLSADVKDSLAARMKFDAENAKGALGRRAQQIIDNVSKG